MYHGADLKGLVFAGWTCEACVRGLAVLYEGGEKHECCWCGLEFVRFKEGGFRHHYYEQCGRGARVTVYYCWQCLDAIRDDLERAAQNANANARRATLIQAMPKWADRDKIRAVYEEAKRISRETGIPHQVDHIVPLNSPFVSGFHVDYNLQILPATDNLKKSNRLTDCSKAVRRKSDKAKRTVEAVIDEQLRELAARTRATEEAKYTERMKPRLVRRADLESRAAS